MLLLAALASDARAAQIIYVNQSAPPGSAQNGNSWANAYFELRTALLDPRVATGTVANPVEIRVARGTYRPTAGTNNTVAFELKSHLRILGGYAGSGASPDTQSLYGTILSGDIGTPQAGVPADDFTLATQAETTGFDPLDPGLLDNSLNILRGSNVTDVIIRNITVTGGYASAPGISDGAIESMVMPLIADGGNDDEDGATITQLKESVAGGGIFFSKDRPATGSEVDLSLENCRFINNHARGYGGAVAARRSIVRVSDVQFLQNQAGQDGGAYWGFDHQCVILNCFFARNSAGAGGGAVELLTLPTRDNTYPEFSDPDVFQSSFGVDRATFQRTLKMQAGAFKLATRLIYGGGAPSALSLRLAQALPKLKHAVGLGLPTATVAAAAKATKALEGVSRGAQMASAAFQVYNIIGLAVTVADFGVLIADAAGADTDNASTRGWNNFSYNFNKYATPIGLLFTLHEALTSLFGQVTGAAERQERQRIYQLTKTQLGFLNTAPSSRVYQTLFRGNTAGGSGGAIEAVRDNLQVENVIFEQNVATTGAGLAVSTHNLPVVLNSIFTCNEALLGYSAILVSGGARPMIVNSTFLNNRSESTEGVAIGTEMGAVTRISNCLLWGNANLDPANVAGGADIYTATRATLTEETRENYDEAAEGRINWVGIADIQNSCIQSLGRLPEGNVEVPLFNPLGGGDLNQAALDALVARYERADAAVPQTSEKVAIERDAVGIQGTRAGGLQAGPGEPESVMAHAKLDEEIEICGPAVVVVARDITGVAVLRQPGCVSEGVPDARPATALRRAALDLVCRVRKSPAKVGREAAEPRLRVGLLNHRSLHSESGCPYYKTYNKQWPKPVKLGFLARQRADNSSLSQRACTSHASWPAATPRM
jgi:predicted outer membrane repeat protein